MSKYIVYDTNIYVMVDFENPKEQGMNKEQGINKAQRMNKAQGITKPVKPNMFSREADGYTIFIRADRVDALAHELCHVIDRVGTKNQFSNQKEFKPLFQQVHEQTSSETNDNEFDDALYLIDAEYNSRNITL